jgi:hypothetical protein
MSGQAHARRSSHSVEYSDVVKRRVRIGDAREQTRSTWSVIVDAIDRRDPADAARLLALAIDEATINSDVMRQWRSGLRTLALAKGITEAELASAEDRLLDLLTMTDGRPFDFAREWDVLLELTQGVQGAAHEHRWADARALVDHSRDQWRRISDRDVDWCSGVMDALVVHCGETVVPEIWEQVLWPLFNWRYDKFDVAKADWEDEILPTLLYVALEAMRTYLSTPDRGESPLELVEHEDRWVIRFDPCGTGGRSMRGEPLDDAGSRLDPPFDFQVIEGAYDWTDGKEGICVYCNHCQVLMEHWPMDRFGYPLRVVDPPTFPRSDRVTNRDAKCQWTIYKDPTAAPPEVYERAGRTKPTEFGSTAHGRRRANESTATFIGGG